MKRFVTASLLSIAFAASAHAGVIETPADAGYLQIDFYSPLGQSFTAEDSTVKFAFDYIRMNPGFPNTPLQFRLLAGEGTGGAVLKSVDFSLDFDFTGFYDIDLSSVPLTVGQHYTAVVSSPTNSPFWGIFETNSVYAGGTAYTMGAAVPVDYTFRVTPTSTSDVPEPGSLALLALGLAGAGAASRRARRA